MELTTLELWVIVVACSLGTFLWRFFGVLFAQRINVASGIFEWVTCVSYAMVAGLVFRLLIMPDNVLASVSLPVRLIAIFCGFGAYYLCGRVLLAGILVGSFTAWDIGAFSSFYVIFCEDRGFYIF